MKNIDLSLYLVTDKSDDVEKFLKTIEEGIKGGVSVVQIREKTAETLDFYNLALKVKEITRKYNVPLIINDRVDVALAIDADGVHVGQTDLPCDVTRKLIGDDKILGVSASTIEEARKAEKDGADGLHRALRVEEVELPTLYYCVDSLERIGRVKLEGTSDDQALDINVE